MKELPTLKSQLYRAFLTLGRNKKIEGSSYTRNKEFSLESLQSEKLKEYASFFDFKGALPITYFYLISQRIQTSLMVEKDFPLPIPGMIHIRTKIDQKEDPILDSLITIKAEVSIINKDEGSLLPEFKETYFQNGVVIAEVKSSYLVKRKRKKGNRKKRVNTIIENKEQNWLATKWRLKGSDSFSYAKLSGDFNPIHISTVFAWLFGFKRKIIHGWYVGSKVISAIEKETDMPAKGIDIHFLNAIILPSELNFEFRLGHDRNLEFRIGDMKGDRFYVSGVLS